MQLQLRYDIVEDRLLLLIAENEQTEAWSITRRGTIMLLTALAARASETLAQEVTGDAKAWMLDSLQEQAAQNVSTDAPPIEADNATILVSVQHGGQENGGHFLNLIGRDGREHAIAFDDASLFSIIELVKQQTTLAEWNIDFTWPTAKPLDEDHCLHLQ